MSRRAALVSFVLVALVGLAGVLAAAADDARPDAFSLNVETSRSLAPMFPGRGACQGPIGALAAFDGIVAYLGTTGPPGAAIDVSVLDATGGQVLARGRIARGWSGLGIFHVRLDATIPRGSSVTVCFRSHGPEPVALLGSRTAYPQTALVVAGRRTRTQAELIFLRPHPPSMLSILPTVFERAALFRPGWVGVWTFWVLAAGVLAAFALTATAVRSAVRADG